MKLYIFKIRFLTICFTFFHFLTYSQDPQKFEKQPKSIYNTSIIINFKKNADRRYMTFQRLNPMFLAPYVIAPPSNIIDTLNKLKTIIKVDIKEPTYLSLGNNLFYIEPKDSLNMNYEVLFHTKTQFKDTLTINHGNIFFIQRDGGIPILQKYLIQVYRTLEKFKSANEVTEYLSAEHLNELTEKYSRSIYELHPIMTKSDAMYKKVKTICSNDFYRGLIYRLKYLCSHTNDKAVKNSIEQSVSKILISACMQKNKIDAFALGKYAAMYVFYKEMNLGESAIRAKFDTCNDTIKQYVLVNLLKDGILENSENKKFVLSKLTYAPLKEAATTIYQNQNRGIEKTGFINNTMRNAKIFDANNKEIAFADLFATTKQSFVIFDFCGTWCKPCLNEIAIYKQTKNLDNSKMIRPIWLFFENDNKKWTDVITKYGLDPKNCYLVLGESGKVLEKEFALSFDWQGEFPHHFLFSKDGKIINKSAPSFSAFSESDLPLSVKISEKNPSMPSSLPKSN